MPLFLRLTCFLRPINLVSLFTPSIAVFVYLALPCLRCAVQSYRQYSGTLVDDPDSDGAEAQFEEYKSQWNNDAAAAFFKAHHIEEWMRQRYHPRVSAVVQVK